MLRLGRELRARRATRATKLLSAERPRRSPRPIASSRVSPLPDPWPAAAPCCSGRTDRGAGPRPGAARRRDAAGKPARGNDGPPRERICASRRPSLIADYCLARGPDRRALANQEVIARESELLRLSASSAETKKQGSRMKRTIAGSLVALLSRRRARRPGRWAAAKLTDGKLVIASSTIIGRIRGSFGQERRRG